MSQKNIPLPSPPTARFSPETPAVSPVDAERRNPIDLFRDLWSQALMTVGGAEEDVRTLLERLSEVIDLHQDDLQRQGRELAERLGSQRKELERSIEESIKRIVASRPSVRPPSADQLGEIHTRLEALSARVGRAESRRGRGGRTQAAQP